MKSTILEQLKRNHLLEAIDVHFARFLGELAGSDAAEILLGAALTSRSSGAGDICLDLKAVSGSVLSVADAGNQPVVCPDLHRWEKILRSSSIVGRPGDHRPLILDEHHRLYLYRYWHDEKRLSEIILRRIHSDRTADRVDLDRLRDGLNRIFSRAATNGVDWQKIAALIAVTKSFCVITGGPGTGKTSTVAAIVALLLEQRSGDKGKILLAAPTGKAAARLGEALKIARSELPVSESIQNRFPTEAVTIHRMLGSIPGTSSFRHNESNPLSADAVIIDEASMVDLALMAKLIQALDDQTQLILIGDKDQLASVEAGAVLGDLCDRSRNHGYSDNLCRLVESIAAEDIRSKNRGGAGRGGLRDCIVELRQSYRFTSTGGIGALSRLVNKGDATGALRLLLSDSEPSVRWIPTSSAAAFHRQLVGAISTRMGEYRKTENPQQALEAFNRFGLLCAVNWGPYGVDAVNRLSESILVANGQIIPAYRRMDRWYAGRPVMITRNDYQLGLFNGDIGIAMPDAPDSTGFDPQDPEAARLFVYFPDALRQGLRKFPPYRLSDHQTVYAMTVHKSQGSEFDTVHLILPEEGLMVLSRELLYTAITRARKEVVIWSPEHVLTRTMERKIERSSGLRDALWISNG